MRAWVAGSHFRSFCVPTWNILVCSRGGDLTQITAEGLKIVLWKGNIEDQKVSVSRFFYSAGPCSDHTRLGFSWNSSSIIHRDYCVCGSQTCVIVNTIADNLNLRQGAVSKALLQAAGPSLQSAVIAAGGRAVNFGHVVITNGFNLSCQKVFHAVCPFWDKGAGKAENVSASFCIFIEDWIYLPK